jgi:HK97 family phage major capsid protein
MTKEEREALIASIKEAIAAQSGKSVEALQAFELQMKENGRVTDGLKTTIEKLNTDGQALAGRMQELEQKLVALPKQTDNRVKTAGQLFIESDELAAFAKKGKGTSERFQLKTITSLVGSGGSGIITQILPGVQMEPLRRFTIRDLIDTGRTTSNLIEWIKENVFTNNADVVSEGAQKPESNITYTREDVPVRTLAHWIHATRQVLADFPQLQTLINGRLTYGLKIAEENQILLGDGTGENLLGLIPQATAYNNSLNRANDTMIDVIRHAILQVRLSYYPATGVALSPTDWHNIELTKDNQNRYMMANPQGVLPAMLWGLPVVESDAMPTDNFLVGAFKLAATLFDREDASIMVSTEDRDNFVKNMVTILCEERLALAVSRPRAFVHGGFPAGSTT